MEIARVKEILKKIKTVKAAVYGDFCLDAYWMMDPSGSEISVETGLQAQAVKKQHYSLGGASNIVANMAAMKPASIAAIGVTGDDVFGRELRAQLKSLTVDTASLVIQKEHYDTITFAKRYIRDREEPRIDFGFFNKRSKQTDEAILASLRSAIATFDVVIFNQQVPGSITNEEFISGANRLFKEFPDKIVLFDSRHYGGKFENVYRKANDIEAARLNGVNAKPGDVIALAELKRYAMNLYERSKRALFITRGPRGILTASKDGIREIPGIQLLTKLDTVGAGDTTISALALCLAAGCDAVEAAQFANFAAAVTVQKLFQTGTASGDEILKIAEDADYIYQPELAEDIRGASYLPGSEIEICCEVKSLPLGKIRHALFDHDGTISTFRQGWEEIMRPVMIKAILGERYLTAGETVYHNVYDRVSEYIDKSTGIETIIQMEALVEIVKEFGIVPAEKILDKLGYKKIYNDALMEMVEKRITRFKTGQMDISDYTIKGAVNFLKMLRQRGVKLYLASGTDHDDVAREAGVLGYTELFDGGIYGAVGDVTTSSKKIVVERIINENGLSGPELLICGDGPVEIRQTRKRNGIALAVASDEVRRHGLNAAKRSRLIKAGAHFVIPDFSQADTVMKMLFKT